MSVDEPVALKSASAGYIRAISSGRSPATESKVGWAKRADIGYPGQWPGHYSLGLRSPFVLVRGTGKRKPWRKCETSSSTAFESEVRASPNALYSAASVRDPEAEEPAVPG